ncbi:gliding motility-associated ABC transporter permease subunit GldF [Capnocytophaga sp.]|uniref:gliding motility-associated ABC transporter permease subunit GldF n=1 Tax=Capnocytophaga sp. TaxID=44737 RepID=UPI0026DD173B|nr:gliding motility-associated ABC transporter permease subunit GldF [Capnocytophaga sp.]MDO5106311.1 gliding motility-associated ABC transporter permease subunit GldF [Capnocytophaga sp.]
MYALFKKEIRYFFTSPIGFTVIGIFVLLNGLFLWILKSDYNIFNSGFADLLPFFRISSWIFVFLVPALTMRAISEEKRSGMLALLFTKPVSIWRMVLGKYFGILFLLVIILIPSFLYIYMVWILGNPIGNLDVAGTIGSYVALLLLVATFAAVGLWASSVTANQIISFVLAAFLCFFLFFGLDQSVELLFPESFSQFGFQSHFEAISRGVIDTRDVLYFLSVIGFFLYVTTLSLNSYKQ